MATIFASAWESPQMDLMQSLLQLADEILEADYPLQQEILTKFIEKFIDCKASFFLLDAISSSYEWVYKPREMESEADRVIQQAIKTKEISHGDQITAVPITLNNTIVGVISLELDANAQLTNNDLALLDGVVKTILISVKEQHKSALYRRREDLFKLIREVSAQIASVLDLDELVQRITHLILETFKYYYVAIFTVELSKTTLNFLNSAGPRGASDSAWDSRPLPLSIRVGEGIIGLVAKTGIEILANNISLSQEYRHIDVLPETKSEYALPLKLGMQTLGVLDIQGDRENSFDEFDMLVLRALADNIAVAIENARLYGELQKKVEALVSITEVSKAIASILDLRDLLNDIVLIIHERFNIPCVHIFTIHYGIASLIYEAGIGVINPSFSPGEIAYQLEDIDAFLPSVCYSRKSAVKDHRVNTQNPHVIETQKSDCIVELAVPLIFGDQVLGILDIYDVSIESFTSDRIALYDALADNLAITLRNANLYKTEKWRRQVADSMQQVAGLLSASVALDDVLNRILQELEHSLPCDAAAIWLIEDSVDAVGLEQFYSTLRLAAVLITDTQAKETGDDAFLSPGITLVDLKKTTAGANLSNSWIEQILNTSNPLVKTDHFLREPLGILLNYLPNYSAIIAPLRIGDQLIGVMELTHRSPGRYGHESQSMIATFASYAAVAIHNTRLYKAAHDQAWVATVLLQVTEATQSITSLSELLQTVTKVIPGLVGVMACAVFTWDEQSELYICATAAGFPEELQPDINFLIIDEISVPELRKLQETKAPVLAGEDIRRNIPIFSSPLMDESLILLLPMISQGDISGLILVVFSGSELAHEENLDQFWDQKFMILQGIAHQTAISAENIRLLNAQEQEAYVLVALLQVAQAVASMTSLEETLSTIVRITPILIGVRKCVIFLWDDDSLTFQLSESYGISRAELDEMKQLYAPQEFPLLQAVHDLNLILYCAMTETIESPLSWSSISKDYFQNLSSSPSDSVSVSELLEIRKPLLFAIPLTVKNKVLGVMMIVEGDSSQKAPPHHIRMKRLEIITGISQQAALAIQNEAYQRENVQRERLEREMQLAREIQKTFLPENIPSSPGWDISIRWQPIYQVGGDFYDIFELPDGNIGFVIADVADKGMPAALFMTLVRTLLRAAIREKWSPAEVLKQVNDLLVPDAKNGMFVTLVYAILSRSTGIITYANAGHNPPLLRRDKLGKIELLLRTGMAIGIFDDVEINEKEIQIEPGDLLVFYTDGITDVFSPDEEMYGLERLIQLIESTQPTDPESLISVVEKSVRQFTLNQPLSDDITLAIFIKK